MPGLSKPGKQTVDKLAAGIKQLARISHRDCARWDVGFVLVDAALERKAQP